MTPAATAEAVPYLSREEIERRAADVLRAHGQEAVPVQLLEITARLGMAVNDAAFVNPNVVGLIARRGDDVTVLVRETDPPLRKRFTIAHELGHYFLHLPGDGDFVDREVNLFRVADDPEGTAPDRRREIQANLFAAALLMPEPAVRAEWARLGSLARMARRFYVSGAAMGIRVAQLGLG